MPFAMGVIGAHWRGSHSPDEILELTRDSNGDVFIREKTSGETVMALRRTGANAYTLYNNTVAGGKIVQDSSMKNAASGIAGLDASSRVAQANSYLPTVSTPVRAMETVYQNTTGRPILVVLTLQNADAPEDNFRILSDAANPPTVDIAAGYIMASPNRSSVAFVVAPSNYYKATNPIGASTILRWEEWGL